VCNYSLRLILGVISVCFLRPVLQVGGISELTLDFNTVDALVGISQQYREIFY
jgi:hypothetical protein